MALPGIVDSVAQAIRIHDGDHDKGAAELAEIALTAATQHLHGLEEADRSVDPTLRTLYAVAADFLNPDLG